MNYSARQVAPELTAQKSTVRSVMLVGEAGLPYSPSLDKAPGTDPIVEWLDLMEVVQMLCPTWPVRDRPMHGVHWRL